MRYPDMENATESGVLYLVPDSNGNGKRVVRKPHPPPTSPPLDEDFDAYTLETREPVTELGTVKDRPTSWAPTSPPLDEDFDAWTYTNTGAPITGTGTIYEEEDRPDSEEEWKEENVQRYGRSNSHRGGLLKRRNRQKLGRNYTSTVSKASGSGALHSGNREQRNGSEIPAQNDELGAGRRYYQHPSSEDHGRDRGRGEISERSLSSRPEAKFGSDSRSKVPKSHTGTSSTRIGSGNHRNGVRDVGDRSNLPLQRDNHHSRQTISRRGPAAHDYEVIDSHVLEEGPERTVTISTWREKVANEARRSEVAMSVYYLSADDYVGNDPGIGERDEFRAPTGQNGYMNGKGKVKQRDLLNDGWVRSKPVYYGSASTFRAYTPWPLGTDITGLSGTSSKAKAPEKGPSRGSTRSVSRAEWAQREYAEPRTSTPVRRHREDTIGLVYSPAPPVPPNGAHINRSARGSSETAISSMHVASTPALEAFLTSCEPSLLYLAPVLVGLGIRTKEHLKAVGRLREETRNKEVREEALKRGMTIMEWAILLDRLQQNG